MASSSSPSPIILKSSDGHTFELEEAAARMSETIRNMIEDDGYAGEEIPLPNVDAATLTKVTEYCKSHTAAAAPDGDSSDEFDKKFIADVKANHRELFSLILAANYLAIKELLDLTCQTVARMIKGKNAEEIRRMLNIKNDFTPEEEENVRKENEWAFHN